LEEPIIKHQPSGQLKNSTHRKIVLDKDKVSAEPEVLQTTTKAHSTLHLKVCEVNLFERSDMASELTTSNSKTSSLTLIGITELFGFEHFESNQTLAFETEQWRQMKLEKYFSTLTFI